MVRQEVTLTAQHQITIPKRVREVLQLHGGDRLELIVTPAHRLVLRPSKIVAADDPAYQLAQQIVKAERQIKRGHVTPWSTIKRRHQL